MKKEFSIHWGTSIQPRKQRKFRYNAPLHVRRKLISAHLDKTLRKEYGKRSIPVKKGDEVKVVRGGFSGTIGKITKVDMKALKVYIDSAKVKKVSGQEVEAPIDPSNLIVTRISLEDKMRKKFVTRKSSTGKTPVSNKTPATSKTPVIKKEKK